MDEEKKNIIQLMLGFVRRANGDHVSAYAAQAAYFLIMSFIPFILFLTTLIRYTPLSYNVVRDAIVGFVPGNLQTFVLSIVVEVYKRSTAIVPLSALMALWASGKGMQAIINGLNTIYHVKETRNWLMNRIYSVFYMLLFVLAIIVTLLVLVLGNRIQMAVQKTIPILGRLMARIMGARTLLVFAVLFVVFLVLYKVLPNRKATFKSQLPGAFIIAMAWLIFSYGFSLYFEFFPNFGNMYGSLTALIMVMLWLYVCMNLILYGAEINAYFENEFRKAQKSVKTLLTKKKIEINKKFTTKNPKVMRKVIIMFALAMGIATANAQEKVTVGENNGSEEQPTLTKEVYPQKEADGDLYHGLTKKLTFDRMIPPHGLEVTYDKTVHVIFPAEVRYVDLGSPDLIAGKADGAENVIRVKATVRNFPNETNMSVITEDGSFYTFNVKYAAEPLLLNVEMCDFIHDGEKVNRPNNAQEIYLKELGSESPMLVRLIMKSIHKQNKREVKHIGCKRFGIQYLLKGIYTHNGLLYFHTEIKNQSNVPFDVDYITWKIVDKKVAKRTAVQERIILPLRAQNYATCVPGKKSERTVFTMAKFTIPDDKCLVVELNEKNGGRHQSFVIENEDLVRANTINELQVR